MAKEINYSNEEGAVCLVIIFDDGSAAITGELNYIIEGTDSPLLKADEILKAEGYKQVTGSPGSA